MFLVLAQWRRGSFEYTCNHMVGVRYKLMFEDSCNRTVGIVESLQRRAPQRRLKWNANTRQWEIVLVLFGKKEQHSSVYCMFNSLLCRNTWSKHGIGDIFTLYFHIAHAMRLKESTAGSLWNTILTIFKMPKNRYYRYTTFRHSIWIFYIWIWMFCC